ncbi:MAG: GlxA family transcriptional regulator [Sandaracinaceae bacterium]
MRFESLWGMSTRVVILLAEGYTDSSLSVVLDVLRTANVFSPGAFELRLASSAGGEVGASSGFVSARTQSLRVAARADVVLVPGLWADGPAAVDALLAREDVRALSRALARAHQRGAIVGAACSGVFVMAEAGLLDGRRATTTWWLAPHLRRLRPSVDVDPAPSLVAESRCWSGGAVFGVADLAFHLVAQKLGPNLAHRCASVLLLHRQPSQAAVMAVGQLAGDDPVVRAAERWVRAHLDRPFDIATLARAVGTSPRTLARRLDATVGMSPVRFVQQIRVETARYLFRTSRLSVEEVSAKVGYADTTTLRRLLKRHLGLSPKALRSSS